MMQERECRLGLSGFDAYGSLSSECCALSRGPARSLGHTESQQQTFLEQTLSSFSERVFGRGRRQAQA